MKSGKKAKMNEENESSDVFMQSARLNNLLALLLIKGEPQPEKIKLLFAAGFSNSEIAQLLSVTANSVNIALHRLRSKA